MSISIFKKLVIAVWTIILIPLMIYLFCIEKLSLSSFSMAIAIVAYISMLYSLYGKDIDYKNASVFIACGLLILIMFIQVMNI